MEWDKVYKESIKKINSGITMSFIFDDSLASKKSDKKFVLEKMKHNGLELEYVSTDLKNDKDVVMTALKNDFRAKKWLGEKIIEDIDVKKLIKELPDFPELSGSALEVTENKENIVLSLEKNLNEQEEKEFIKIYNDIKKNDFNSFINAEEKIRKNKSFILNLLDENTGVMQFLSDELKNDMEIALFLAKKNTADLKYLGDEIKNNIRFVLKAMKINVFIIEFISDNLSKNQNLIKKAIKINGMILLSLDESLKNDKELVLYALRNNGYIFRYFEGHLSKNIYEDRDVCLQAVLSMSMNMDKISDRWKNNRDFLIDVLKNGGTVFPYIAEHLVDKELILLQCENDGAVFQNFKGFEDDEVIAENAIKSYGGNIVLFNDKIKNDEKYGRLALTQDIHILTYLGKTLKNSITFVNDYLDEEGFSLVFLGEDLINNENFVEKILNKRIEDFEYIGSNLKKNQYFVNKYLQQDPSLLLYCPMQYWVEKNILNLLKVSNMFLESIHNKMIYFNMEDKLQNIINNQNVSFIKYLSLEKYNFGYLAGWRDNQEIIFHALSNWNRGKFRLEDCDIFDHILPEIKEDKNFLYKVKKFIDPNANKVEYQLLMNYEREDSLELKIKRREKDIKMKKKI